MSQNLHTLLTVAAELRSGGASWEAVARTVRRRPSTCQGWPSRFRADWEPLYRRAQDRRLDEAGAEALALLRRHLRDAESKTSLRAAELMLRYGRRANPAPAGAEETEADREWAGIRALTEDARRRFDADRAARGLPPATDDEFYAAWARELSPAARPPAAGVYFDARGTAVPPPATGGLAVGALLLAAALAAQFPEPPANRAAGDKSPPTPVSVGGPLGHDPPTAPADSPETFALLSQRSSESDRRLTSHRWSPASARAANGQPTQGNQQPGLVGLFDGFRARTPQLYVDVDREKVKVMGVPLTDVFDALQGYLGSYYVNDFNRFGRTWQVNVQADARFRTDAEAARQLKVRNSDGDMVPLGAVAEVRDRSGPVQITRYNMFPAAAVSGASLPGTSTGDVLAAMERLADQGLPKNMTSEWTELSYLQKQSSQVEQFRDLRQNPFSAFVLGAVLVFFVLAGLYEGWSLPLAVILVVPMCLSSALAGIALAHLDVDVFVQVAFVVLVGLACKNAILIVEFARDRELEGAGRFEAAVEAARVRLRPILMTSFAFVLGVFPLVVAAGAGAEMRRTLGTAVFAGMIGVTLFGLFLTPVFFHFIRGLVGPAVKPAAAAADGPPRGHGVAPPAPPAAASGERGT
jgi:hypothetical protein